ncbi:hypothetical protein AB0L59_30190 [Streptomyces sp. NPDC052109]|uniref:hypothetical protein n=1 Tax=Streptomyces sp. NPDC052109 TaxID=3155527 RepID=UPI00343236B8
MDARRRLVDSFARTAPDGVKALVVTDYTAGDSPWVDGLAERLATGDVTRCKHLVHGSGSGFLYASEGYGRCLDCHVTDAAGEIAQGRAAGGMGAACQRCRAAVEPTLLRPVAVELAPWVVLSALCPLCAAVLLHEGQRGQGLAAVAGGVG